MRKNNKNFLCKIWLIVNVFSFLQVLSADETIQLTESYQVKSCESSELHFDLKEIPKGKQVRLCMDARIEWGCLGGHTTAMKLTLNDRKLLGKYLLNKPLNAICRNGSELIWSRSASHGYTLMYAPDFTGLRNDKKYPYRSDESNQDPFRFVWDITSFVNEGDNVLNVTAVEYIKTLRLGNVSVEVGGETQAAINLPPPPAPAPTGVLPIYEPQDYPAIQPPIEVSQLGDIHFKLCQEDFYLYSRTSLPSRKWSNDDKHDKIWTQLCPGKIFIAKWEESNYTVERKIELLKEHISVKDTIQNTSDKLIGVMFENKLSLPSKSLERGISNLPSGLVLARFKSALVGMVAEDDIFRLHAVSTINDKEIGLSDLSLGIGAGQAHTLEWSIYLPSGRDYNYWDLINVIRRNWGSNITLKFPLSTGGYTTVKPNAYYVDVPFFHGRSPQTDTLEAPASAHGSAALLAEEWCSTFKKGIERAKSMESTRLFVYTHHNLCSEPGYWDKYKDSLPEGVDGKPMLSTAREPNMGIFVPTLHSSYGNALTKVYKYFANMGADIYIDEITCGVPGGYDYRKDVWDGCSVVINPETHVLVRKRSNAFLLMQPWRSAMMEYLKSKDRIAVANGPIITRTMLGWQMPCFVELGSGPMYIVQSHLGTAWVWTYSHETAIADARTCLDYGAVITLCQWPMSFIRKMYPITPIELRPGFVIGKERIITNRSGQFGWGDDSRADVYVFDGNGKPVEKPDVKEICKDNKVLTELRIPEDHLAILVRKHEIKSLK